MNAWSKMWPIDAGWYWFFGDRGGMRDMQPYSEWYLMAVQVRPIRNGMMYVADGHFLDSHDRNCVGVWLPMTVPTVPTESEVANIR